MLVFYERGASTPHYTPATTPPSLDGGNNILIFSDKLTRADAENLIDRYSLPSSIVSDAFDANELPRIETWQDRQYVFLRTINANGTTHSSTTKPILFIVGNDMFSALSTDKLETQSLLVDLPEELAPKTAPGELLIRSIFTISKQYEDVIDKIGNHITQVEKRMHSHDATNEDFFSFVTIEGSLNRASMNLVGLSTVCEKLAQLRPEDDDRFDDIVRFARQLLVEVESHLNTVKSIREAYSTVANNTLNQRMKILTALTLLLAIPNVFFGMYGMNITLPFMDEPWAYPLIMLFSGLVILSVYLVVRRRKFF